jgi:hypothetical protein
MPITIRSTMTDRATVLRALRVLILCAEHATSLGQAEIGNTTFRSLACRRRAVLAVQLILGPMPERCSRSHRRAPLPGVYTLAWSDHVHLDEICVSDRHSYRVLLPDRQELPLPQPHSPRDDDRRRFRPRSSIIGLRHRFQLRCHGDRALVWPTTGRQPQLDRRTTGARR